MQRDVGLEALEKLAAGRLEEAKEAHQGWYQLAAQEWNWMQTGEVPDKVPKEPRSKAFKWLASLDSMLLNYG